MSLGSQHRPELLGSLQKPYCHGLFSPHPRELLICLSLIASFKCLWTLTFRPLSFRPSYTLPVLTPLLSQAQWRDSDITHVFLQPLNKRLLQGTILNLSSHLQILMFLCFILPVFCMLFLFWWLHEWGLRVLSSLDLIFMAIFSKLWSTPSFHLYSLHLFCFAVDAVLRCAPYSLRKSWWQKLERNTTFEKHSNIKASLHLLLSPVPILSNTVICL